MSKKVELKERFEKVKEKYRRLFEDEYQEDFFNDLEAILDKSPGGFEFYLEILESDKPYMALDVPHWTSSEIHIGSDWDIEDNEFDEDD